MKREMKNKRALIFVFIVGILFMASSNISIANVGQLEINTSMMPLEPAATDTLNTTALREQIISWINTTGVLMLDSYRVHSAMLWNGSDWKVDNDTRIDAQCEVAMAFTYQYFITKIEWFKNVAIQLLLQAYNDSQTTNNGEVWQCSWMANNACFTQDNGRQMRIYAIAVAVYDDIRLRSILTNLTDFWVSQIPENGSLGSGAFNSENNLPDKYPSARHIGEMLIGMMYSYKVLNNPDYLLAARRLAMWLTDTQLADGSYLCPSGPRYNSLAGNYVEATSLSIWGLSELYSVMHSEVVRSSLSKAYEWIKQRCNQTNLLYNVSLPSGTSSNANLRYFNTLYLQTPAALLAYAKYTNNMEAREQAITILDFMCSKMMMSNNGIVGEWDLLTDSRSTFMDFEHMIWGNVQYVGWTNCETVEALSQLELNVTIPLDMTPPEWVQLPANQTIKVNTAFAYDLNATDKSEISWSVNDTIHFSIDANGIIRNATELMPGKYGLEVYVTDAYNNVLSVVFAVTVQPLTLGEMFLEWISNINNIVVAIVSMLIAFICHFYTMKKV